MNTICFDHRWELKDFIKVFDNAVPYDLCDAILKEYVNDSWNTPKIINNNEKSVIDTTVRNCKIIPISTPEFILKNQLTRKNIDDKIFEVVGKIIGEVYKNFPTIGISQDSGYDLLKYETGGFYSQHVDLIVKQFRTISCSLCLNDDYEGGEFAFFDQKLKYNLKKGSAIIFPSNYMYPHEIMTVTSGTRYSIITWFM